ncbi:MAG: aminotransferase class I/II-fold pyridoxal phosphate-dependent enzyme [Saprospiraceae bacterium]|nr:aminotransferase class I/II-fold pyridoxal phosphate-dependent enzyme [Saprospiraceae bacterium]
MVNLLADYLEKAQSATPDKTIPYVAPEDNLAFWQADLAKGIESNPLDFFTKVVEKSTKLHNPRYIGHQVSTVAPLSALSQIVMGMMNNGGAVYEMGMVTNSLERVVTDWLSRHFGFEAADGGGIITSGGTLANLTALLAARAVSSPTDDWTNGTTEKLALLVSEEAHYCVDRAARIMGWGAEGIIKVPTNERFQMKTDLLDAYFEKAEAEGRRVIAVVGSACSTSTGSYDDLEAIADFAERRKIWFHIDGAHGGAAILSKKYRSLLRGAERANSIIVDFHKMMMVSSLATAVLFRNPSHSYQTFHQKAQYLWENADSQDWFNLGKRTFECTKPMLAVKVYVLLKTYGDSVFEEFIDKTHNLATEFAQILRRYKNFKIGVEPQSNIVCFRFLGRLRTSKSKKKELSLDALNELNSAIRLKLIEKGDFYIVQTTLRGEVFLRVSIMNPLTTIEHLKELIKEIILLDV